MGKICKLGIIQKRSFGGLAALEEAGEALRRKLNGSQRVLNFVGNAPCNFLPRGGLLGTQHLGEVIENENVSAVSASGTERTSPAPAPNMRVTAWLARRRVPVASREITPVGIFSRTVSMSWRRRSSS